MIIHHNPSLTGWIIGHGSLQPMRGGSDKKADHLAWKEIKPSETLSQERALDRREGDC